MRKDNTETGDELFAEIHHKWLWITLGVLFIVLILWLCFMDGTPQPQPKPKRSYEEIFTPEECEKMGIGKKPDGPGDWKPDPNGAQKFREFIEKGGNADPALDAIQDGDYHDLLDQMGGPEGF